jgi:predicted adenine nucleotide alpha hydrolase (AANH) superfamily ATPase
MKVLLHICCGVCAAGAATTLLSEGHRVTGYFYNPNICPEEEYRKRLDAAIRSAQNLGYEVKEGSYEPSEWMETVKGLEREPEGGARCTHCYRFRLLKSYQFMLGQGLDAFTTTLTISPHKQASIINRIGREIGGDRFMQRDFKKKDGFKQAITLARCWELYRQNYCGCIYSSRGGS